jgi:hypothetical protein
LKGTLLLKEKLSLALETYKEKLSIRFKNCTVTHGETILFQPEWGVYDMAEKSSFCFSDLLTQTVST